DAIKKVVCFLLFPVELVLGFWYNYLRSKERLHRAPFPPVKSRYPLSAFTHEIYKMEMFYMDSFSASLMKDKREIIIAPTIYKFQNFGEFAEEFSLGERDVVLTNEFIYKPFMEQYN